MSSIKLLSNTTAAGPCNPPPKAVPRVRPSLEGRELGYLLLDDCYVHVLADDNDVNIEDASHPDKKQWMDIQVPRSAREKKFMSKSAKGHHEKTEAATPSSIDQNIGSQKHVCIHCHLVLKSEKQPDDSTNDTVEKGGSKSGVNSNANNPPSDASFNRFFLVNDGPRYDGTIDHAKPSKKECVCVHRGRQRSDAALLVGLALASHDLGHITIKSIKICRYGKAKDVADDYSYRLIKQNAAVFITFTCFEIVRKPMKNGLFEQLGKRRYLTNSAKPFPPSTQLLLSLMSSDWKEYDAQMEEVENRRMLDDSNAIDNAYKSVRRDYHRKKQQSLSSFFPSKMTLEEVYTRIGGATSLADLCMEQDIMKSDDAEKNEASNDSNTEIVANITILPGDVLCHRIGSYLRARSLDALRCTCKRLHTALRGVVPGLKLELYSHQIKSLLWMRWRETKQITENDLIPIDQHSTLQSRINSKEADAHRAATGGGSVVLSPRETKEGVRISQTNGDELEIPTGTNELSRTAARGGLLCDDPGLGKTITVLALILQTMGLSTENPNASVTPDSTNANSETSETQLSSISPTGPDAAKMPAASNAQVSVAGSPANSNSTTEITPTDDRIFNEYWKEHVMLEFRCRELTKLFNTFLKSSAENFYFFENSYADPFGQSNVTQNPICLKDIRKRIQMHAYGDSFVTFQTDVELCFMNAMLFNSIDTIVHQAARRLTVSFTSMVNDFKRKQITSAKKSFARTTSKPNSVVAALVEKTNVEKLKNALVPSSGTLLVVPTVLLDHWKEQLELHVDPSYCTARIPLIFEYTGTNETGLKMEEIMVQCQVKKTHFPYIFVDRVGAKKLPSPFFLAMFRIVITTNHRFSCEWKNGSFEDELKRQALGTDGEDFDDFRSSLSKSEEACPLLKVNWIRMIVDEGHSMGRGKDNSSISFASWINAERRWAMTGTPTPQTLTQSGLSNVLNLMQFMKHEFFSRRLGGDNVWNNLIIRGWNRGFVASFFRLRSLLSLLMVRHTKSDIEELPPPIYKTTVLPMSQEEVTTYNTLVCAVQSNLLITSMKGKTSGAQDSLLHKSQTRHAREAVSNLRLVCVGGTQVQPTLSEKHWDEFCTMFDSCNDDETTQREMREFLTRATSGEPSPCGCCQVMLNTLLVFPCGHLVCTECADNTSTCCIICDKEFDVDAFQRLQPGFVYNWLHNIEQEKLNAANNNENLNDDDDLIGHNNNGGIFLPGGAGMLALDNPDQVRNRTHRAGDGHECVYNPKNPTGECRLCFKPHEPCYLVNEERRCRVCYRKAEDCPSSETKPSYIIDKLLTLFREQQEAKKTSIKTQVPMEYRVDAKRPLKVIVFSQFRKILDMTGDRLLRRFGNGCVAEYWGLWRRKELQKFIHDDHCFCMLLTKDGSEGLDLSFVTHIIFLEQVWDKSLETQAVARAWRMGATGPVEVETLIAENSIEETMSSLEKGHDGDTRSSEIQAVAEGNKTSEYQRAKVHYLLKSLRLITNSSTLAFAAGAKRKASEIAVDAHEDSARRKKKRSTEMIVRFQEQQETYEYDVN